MPLTKRFLKDKKFYTQQVVTEAATVGTDTDKARKDRLSEKRWEIVFNPIMTR